MMIEAQNLSAATGIRHGFFTREGGVSEGLIAALNCGSTKGDDKANVAANRARAMARLGMDASSLHGVKQVHGNKVRIIREPDHGSMPEADALATRLPGLTLGVLSADCAPVLIADPGKGIIGAAHAGWRGALGGVIEGLIEAMIDLGSQGGDDLIAAIGPCIAKPSYEVAADMRARFENEDQAALPLFEPIEGRDRFRFDLKAYALLRLKRAGLENSLALPEDTYVDAARFFSARRAYHQGEPRFGLLLSAIALAA